MPAATPGPPAPDTVGDTGKAVFLSYASQDAEAAKKICDALRTAGLEVWFDAEGGLEHGDEWDAKIRRQIKECVLFLPIISANTQAREEGYFRIEWELAAERAMGIASGTAFILPIVIDDTREPAALVPDRFRKVQWTKLPGGVLTPEVQARFLKLWSHRAGVVSHHAVRAAETVATTPSAPAARLSPLARVGPALLLIAGLVGLYFWVRPQGGAVPPAAPARTADAATNPAPAAMTARDWPKNPELKRAIGLLDRMDAIPEDLRLAEEIVQQGLAKAPTDPETVTAMARVHSTWLLRGWDRSTARYQKARAVTERALQLAPDEAEAHCALAIYLYARGGDPQRAREAAQRAIELVPQEARFHRMRDNILFTMPEFPTDEAIASALRTVALFPRDPLVHYELSRHYRNLGRWPEFARETDATLALGPVANAMVWKARADFGLRGDLAAMKHQLDQVPARVRVIERTVYSYFLYAAFSSKATEGLDALHAMPESWMIDFDYRGPKALLVAALLEQAGKKELARLQYTEALLELRRAQESNPSDVQTRLNEAWILHGLGRDEEARAALSIFNEAIEHPYLISPISTWWFQPIAANLIFGERPTALELLREAGATAESRATLRARMALDRRMAAFRDDPEIKALLAEPAAQKTEVSAPIDQKSVAVLAFANLSDDKGNEYFSDGISEELLNVLAKIPGLKVSARTSAFYFKGKEVPIPEIAKQLGVAYVVEGSVRKQGDKVRITAQLIKAADGFHVWSDTFTRDLKDIFAVQDEIAGLIAKNLSLKMGMAAARPTIDLEAYQVYLAGRAAVEAGTTTSARDGIEHFRTAVRLEPKFTAAWVQIARTYVHLSRWGGLLGDTEWQETRRAMDRAVALEPSSPDVWLALGWVRRTADWNWRGAEQALREALRLRPDHAETQAALGVLLANFGREEEAVAMARRAAELDPLNAATQMDLLSIFYSYGRYAEAVEAGRRAIQLAPRGQVAHSWLAMSLVGLRRFPEAETEATLEPEPFARQAAKIMIAAKQGRMTEARELVQEFEKRAEAAGGAWNSYAYLAFLCGHVGQAAKGIDALEMTRMIHDPSIAWTRTNFFADVLHTDPRWPEFLRKVGLADEQLK